MFHLFMFIFDLQFSHRMVIAFVVLFIIIFVLKLVDSGDEIYGKNAENKNL